MATNDDQSRLTTSQSNSRPDIVPDTSKKTSRRVAGRQEETEWKNQYKAMNEELLKDKLIQGTKYKDKHLLEKSIKDYYDSGLPTEGNDILEDAGKQLDILRTKEALVEATHKRDVNDIQLLLKSIDQNEKEIKKKLKDKGRIDKGRIWHPEDGYQHHLLFEMTEAKKVLRVVESGRDKNRPSLPTTLKMDRNTMSEIKRYKKPPEGLHGTMQASFLLLGIDEEITGEWASCAKLSNPDGRQGLYRRLQILDTSKIEPEICARAKELLEKTHYKKILKASAGGAAFFTWAMGTVDKYSETRSLEGIEPADIERQKELLRPESERNKDEQPMFIPRINKPRKAALKPDEQFQRNLRAPHSGGRAANILVEPKQYSKSDY